MDDRGWVVHKFGGTSVANAERYRNVVRLLEADTEHRKAVVVSAMSGVTDSLIGLLEQAKRRGPDVLANLETIKARHLGVVEELLSEPLRPALREALESGASDIAGVLRTVSLGRGYSDELLELVAGHGELWSAQLLCGHLRTLGQAAAWLDARQVLVVADGDMGPVVDWTRSVALLKEWVARNPADWTIITGYVASRADGAPTTLKRNGSDFSASIFSSLLEASSITIWKEVDGVLSADPKRVPNAVVLQEMSYDEAMELAYFGAKILHPQTMAPAIARKVPIWIRNSFDPTAAGTEIHGRPRASNADTAIAVKGFASIDEVAIVNVEGTGMVGVPGIAQRLFSALRDDAISVIMISQGSSEHSICVVVRENEGARAREIVERAFVHELRDGHIERVSLQTECSILAAVGDGMANVPGVTAKFFGALAKAGVSVRAIAQGSSERNISVVVDKKNSTRALHAVHSGFYLSDHALAIGVIGDGLIGRTFMRQLHERADALHAQFRLDLRVRGIMNSRVMLLGDPGIRLNGWLEGDRSAARPADVQAFVDHLQGDSAPQAVIIDCTASEAIAEQYPSWIERGIHVITPNKRAGSGPIERFERIRRLGRQHYTHFFCEATVGAGLPVISTLRDLIQTGDKLVEVEGVLSGTLSYVFNTLTPKGAFSKIIQTAKELGYTEPDPRDDLSGMDVARKLVILAREAGITIELKDIEVQNLVPESLRAGTSVEEFLQALATVDPQMRGLCSEANASGEVLRYVGALTADGRARVGLRRYPLTHPFARVSGTDNIISFKTRRYFEQPLLVQGPGAGPEVTAGGVFADLLRLVGYLAPRPESRPRWHVSTRDLARG
jgi:aspartokinase/homoserine dehydrogenase 1